jgi:hypothetical protein
VDEKVATEQWALDTVQQSGCVPITTLNDKRRQVGLISNAANIGCGPVFSLWMGLDDDPIATARGVVLLALPGF